MLGRLESVLTLLPFWVREPETWQSLRVTYEKPQVDRLWRQVGTDRVYLHRIHPCEKPLFHPHPWPSAVQILSGAYAMAVGYGTSEPPVAATLVLTAGSRYEMVDPNGWHSVRPLDAPSLSVMVTGLPWDRTAPGKGQNPEQLPDDERDELFEAFRQLLPVPSELKMEKR